MQMIHLTICCSFCFYILKYVCCSKCLAPATLAAKEILLSGSYPWGGCGAYYWGYENCRRTWYRVYCDVNPTRCGGYIVYVYQKGHWRWCRAEGRGRGARCNCYHDSTNNRVKCYSSRCLLSAGGVSVSRLLHQGSPQC